MRSTSRTRLAGTGPPPVQTCAGRGPRRFSAECDQGHWAGTAPIYLLYVNNGWVTSAPATDTALAADLLAVVARIHRLATQRVRTLLPYARAQPAVGDRRAQFGAAMRPGSTRRVASCAQGKSSIVSPSGGIRKTRMPPTVRRTGPTAIGIKPSSRNRSRSGRWSFDDALKRSNRPRILLRLRWRVSQMLVQMCWEPQAAREYLRCKQR